MLPTWPLQLLRQLHQFLLACTNPSQPSLLLSIVSWFSQLCCNIKEVSSCQHTVTRRSETYVNLQQHQWTLMMRRPELGFEFVANIHSMQILSIKTKKLNRCHESAMYHQIQNRPTGANHSQSSCWFPPQRQVRDVVLGDILRPASHLQTLCEMPQRNGKRLVAGRLQASQIASSGKTLGPEVSSLPIEVPNPRYQRFSTIQFVATKTSWNQVEPILMFPSWIYSFCTCISPLKPTNSTQLQSTCLILSPISFQVS